MYLVLRSTRAKGRLSLQRAEFAPRIRLMVIKQADNCRIELLQFQNHGCALHFLIRIPSRACYLRFVRSICGLTSRMVTGSERGPSSVVEAAARTASKGGAAAASKAKKNRFWDVLPYSSIASGCTTIRAAQKRMSEAVQIGMRHSFVRTTRASARSNRRRI